MLSIIVASDINGGIGKDNKLLFHIKDDLKRFKELTTGKTIIMGRKTYESLPNGALPNRHNIVITTSNRVNTLSPIQSLIFKNNIEELIDEYKDSKEEVFVIGGGFIYKQFLPYCKKIYLTRIYDECKADTFFHFDGDKYTLDEYTEIFTTKDGIDYSFLNLIRD